MVNIDLGKGRYKYLYIMTYLDQFLYLYHVIFKSAIIEVLSSSFNSLPSPISSKTFDLSSCPPFISINAFIDVVDSWVVPASIFRKSTASDFLFLTVDDEASPISFLGFTVFVNIRG